MNQAGRFAEGEAYSREALAVIDANGSPEFDGRRAQTLWELGMSLKGERRFGEAANTLERAAGIYEHLGPAWARRAEEARKTAREIR